MRLTRNMGESDITKGVGDIYRHHLDLTERGAPRDYGDGDNGDRYVAAPGFSIMRRRQLLAPDTPPILSAEEKRPRGVITKKNASRDAYRKYIVDIWK